ncbi:MAG: cysteine--tRNA ligase [Methylacidiphilales bacterium]|nr:cysteine--tRNA ligase [Candidatus Methylacidiphilales bacterium]
MKQDVQLYDTLERRVKPIRPLDGKTVRFYCCGPTVYGPAHIGNFRTFVSQDILRRVLELGGQPTRHVRNITDVDDKTIRQSQAEGRTLKEFTDAWLELFRRDCGELNLLPPHIEPSAVEHIPGQVDLIQKLMDRKHAYRADDGSVYFSIDSFPEYGRLSRVKERELSTNKPAAAGQAIQADEYERESLADFALWKARKAEDGPNFWRSPWSEGRPGWHLECSCMSMRYLGESFDLHGGGVDLIFPHHENEIAQSEAATGKPFASHWFHTTHLLVEGRKMSKSEGNLFTLEELKAKGFSAMEVRYVLLAGKYSQPLNFTIDSLSAARQALQKIARSADALAGASGCAEPAYDEVARDAQSLPVANPFNPAWEALRDDLNTSEALGQTFLALKETDSAIREGRLAKTQASEAWLGLQRVLHALGLVLPKESEITAPPEIRELAAKRWEAKKNKDWKAADTYRDQLASAGWVMQDGKDSYKLAPDRKNP